VKQDRDATGYIFGRPERGTTVLGIEAPRLAILIGGLAVGLVCRQLVVGIYGDVAFVAALVAGAVLAMVRLDGRHLDGWVWLGLRTATSRTSLLRRPSLPELEFLPNVALLTDPVAGHGVVRERLRHREWAWSGVLRVGGSDFSMASDSELAMLLGRWGRVLAHRCRQRSPVRRLQLLDRGLVVPNHAHLRHLEVAGDPRSPFYREYWEEQLRQQNRPAHDYLAVVQVAGRLRDETRLLAALRSELESLRSELADMLATSVVALSERQIAFVLRSSSDADAQESSEHSCAPEAVAPSSEHAAMQHYVAQRTLHATLWVREWPRSEVPGAFLLPLLLETHSRRTFSLVMAPVPPPRSARRARGALAAQQSEAGLRGRHGFSELTGDHQRHSEAVRRERELAHGEQEFRFAGYLTVSAFSAEELEEAVAEVEARAAQSQLDVVRLFGQQRQAFTFSLPLARGL